MVPASTAVEAGGPDSLGSSTTTHPIRLVSDGNTRSTSSTWTAPSQVNFTTSQPEVEVIEVYDFFKVHSDPTHNMTPVILHIMTTGYVKCVMTQFVL